MQRLNDYFTDNYQWLVTSATNLCAKLNKTYLTSDLISNTYLHLNKVYTDDLEDNQIKAIIINYMNMQVVWSNTKLKRTIIDETPQSNLIVKYTNQEDDSQSEEEVMEEYMEEQFEIQNKINFIHSFIAKAKPEDRLLFDIVFNQGYNNSGKLARHSGLSRTTCYTLIRNLKNKIKKSFNEQN
jgi:hypothetical protein